MTFRRADARSIAGLMRLLVITILALIAFAANSVLNRSALALEEIGPGLFQAIRMTSGAAMLIMLVAVRERGIGSIMRHGHLPSAAMLLLYMIGFSYAYLSLETGIGALLLFGGVQVTMFAGAILSGERPSVARLAGAGLGLGGLAVLFWPGVAAPSPVGAALMSVAAVGWGVYSLFGRRPGPPLSKTAANFILALPVAILIAVLFPDAQGTSGRGIALAVASGALASGVGYALWYSVLPRLDATLAAVAQLTVPIIALSGGIVFLGEPLTFRFLVAAVLIMGGVLLALDLRRR